MPKKIKVLTVVGARPQFVKVAAVSRAMAKLGGVDEVLVHTGQHYDHNMSQVFFDELGIPEPKHFLKIGSGQQGAQTGEMLGRCEQVMLEETPDVVLVYGDTNSTLAGALAAVKLHIPVAHVEAGLRSFNRRMPEEINRVVADHVSELLFVPTQTAQKNLTAEGVTKGVHLVGDVMYDAVMEYREAAMRKSHALRELGLEEKSYFLATVHRAENTDDPERLKQIVRAFAQIAETGVIVWPVHPRTKKRMGELEILPEQKNIRMIEPAPYLDMIALTANAAMVLTDSGGLQKEACWLGAPCVTLRDETEWVETVESGWNQLAGADAATIVSAVKEMGGKTLQAMNEDAGASRRVAEMLVERYG